MGTRIDYTPIGDVLLCERVSLDDEGQRFNDFWKVTAVGTQPSGFAVGDVVFAADGVRPLPGRSNVALIRASAVLAEVTHVEKEATS